MCDWSEDEELPEILYPVMIEMRGTLTPRAWQGFLLYLPEAPTEMPGLFYFAARFISSIVTAQSGQFRCDRLRAGSIHALTVCGLTFSTFATSCCFSP